MDDKTNLDFLALGNLIMAQGNPIMLQRQGGGADLIGATHGDLSVYLQVSKQRIMAVEGLGLKVHAAMPGKPVFFEGTPEHLAKVLGWQQAAALAWVKEHP
jgi:hypothetical protein